ncbi:hypothetical protein A2886_01970 [candidate division WWE3 bacterium RIFCSPHIGHO2_01_FULL_42_13]|uniref:DUF192 domain-containing protein n=1 Tax=candidate division WWE3 bacterium RIFCSPHIGHO2_01_FULL_42_13 TaxID=1802617 RepID=A0A1F4UR28_UNCKA|nr:MAG: hypothetical protein A2886_01970 [candidate division WWE3 bacterium RIFCSPHIGHO2_01_FULL_42_13]
MSTKAFLILIAVVGVLLVLFIAKEFLTNKLGGVKNISHVKIGEAIVKVELADTVAKRAKGLMFRKGLGENEGMLFIFPSEGKHTFWMANTYIPLDIIWISADMKIVHIEENVQPCGVEGSAMDKLRNMCRTYGPSENAKYVLEVGGGWIKNNEIAHSGSVDFFSSQTL